MLTPEQANIKDERFIGVIKDLAAEFVARHSNRQSLLTVTRVEVSNDLKHANVMLSVFPRTAEHAALDFLNRHSNDFRDMLKERSRLFILPFVKFFPDEGEYNRQRISEILDEDEKKAN